MTSAGEEPGPEGRLLRFARGLGQGAAALVGLALLGVASGVILASQTASGRRTAAGFLERTLAGAVEGRVEVGRITGGNLLTRVELERLRIADAAGTPFLELEDVRAEYGPLGLLTGDVHLRRLRVGRLALHLRDARQGGWNFERIFGGEGADTVSTRDGGGLRLRVTDATVEDGRITVRTPWEGPVDEGTVWRIRPGPEGPVRVIALEEVRGSLPLLRLADPRRPMRVEASRIRARALAVRQPLRLERLDVAATFGDTVRVELPEVRTARSRVSGEGRVLPTDPLRWQFDLTADPLAFEDLGWLPVPVPGEGGGRGELTLRTAADPEVVAVEVSRGDFRAGGSRAEGRFTLYLEETPRLEDVALELQPLELALYRRLTGQAEGPDGRVEGTVAGAGPLDLVRVDADLRLRPPPAEETEAPGSGDTAGGASGLRLTGGVGLTGEPRTLRELEVELTDLAPRWIRLLGIDTRQEGRLDGRITLDRVPEGRVAFTADLRHRRPDESSSHVTGQGSFRPGESGRVDLRLRADPLSLSVLDPWFPAVQMRGSVRGPFSLSGTLADLQASADLRTPRGELEFDGRFDLAARRKRYDARLTAREIQLQQWIRDGPHTRLDVTGRVQGRGTDPDSLEASFDLEVLPSRFHGARLDTSLLRFTVRRGRASIDTFAVRSDVGTLQGRGGFGLGRERTGSLFLDLEAPDLSRWNRWVVPGRLPESDTTARDLFATFPALGAEEREDDGGPAPPDTLAGSLSVRGVASGNLASFGFGGSVAGHRLRWGEAAADSLRVTVSAARVRSLDSLVVEGRGRDVGWMAHRADSASFRLARTGEDRARLRLDARRKGRGAVSLRAEAVRAGARTEARLDSLLLEVGPQRLRLTRAAVVARGDSGLSVRNLEMVGEEGGRLRIDGAVPTRGQLALDLELRELDLGGLAGLARPGTPARGTATGSARLRGTAGAPTLDARLAVAGPGWGPLTYDSLSVALDYRDRRLEGRVDLLRDGRELLRARGSLQADLALRGAGERIPGEDPLRAEVRADSLPLALLLLPAGALRDVRGSAVGRLEVRGRPGSPRVRGELSIRDGAARAVPVGIDLRRLGGRVVFEGTRARIDSLGMASGRGGTTTVHGEVGLSDPTDPAFDLEIRSREFHGIDRRRAAFRVDGRAHLGGSYRRALLSGEVRVSNGTVRIREFLRQGEVVDLTDPELYALMDTAALAERRILARVRDPFMENLRMELAVTLGPDLWLRSPELSVEVAGEVDVRMDRARGDLAATGPVRLVRGTYRFTGARGVLSRQLRITRGRIEFVGTPGGNPNLDVTAVHRVRQEEGTIRVEAHVTGTMLEPTLELTSDPPLGEADQICVLLLNSVCGAPEAGALARRQLLGRVGAELSSVLASEVGFDYLELRGGTRGSGGEDTGAAEEGSFLSRAEVEAGWYLSPEVFLTVTYPVGSRFPAGSLDWRFAEDWSLELLSELRFGTGLRPGAASNLERERTWGLFLFREWSF